MKKPQILLLFLFSLLCSTMYAQSDYYWSGGKKINLKIDSTKIILYSKTFSDLPKAKEKLSLMNGIKDVKEISVGVRKALELKFGEEDYNQIQKNILEYPETSFAISSYSYGDIPFYFTNEI